MIRRLRVSWLAAIVVLALSAITAPAAHAEIEFTASAYSATVTGSNTKGNETFTTEGGSVQCDSHFEGKLSASSSTLTITPKYSECDAFGFLGATVETEGCTYVFHATEEVSAGVYDSHVDVSCPEGKSIKIAAATCKAEVKAQTGLTTVKSTNSGSSVTVQPNVTGIAMTVTQDGFGCPFAGTGAKTGSYHGDVLVSRVGGGSVSVSGEKPVEPTRGFEASSYPATYTGSNTQGSEAFTTEAGAVRCQSHFVSNSISAKSETLTLTPTFSDCTQVFGSSSGSISMEGCTFVLKATEKVEANVYKHHVDVVCPEGKSIKFEGNTCKAEIKGQSSLTTVMTTNLAAGTVTMQPNLPNVAMTVTQDGGSCPFSGTGSKTATYHGDVVLSRVGGGTVFVSGH